MLLGIDNLKKAALLGIDIGKQVETALADGKFSWVDSFGFLDELIKVPGIINSRKDIIAEYKDLTEAEREELKEYIQDNLDLINDELEGKIEKGLDIIFSILNFISKDDTATAFGDGGDRPTTPPTNP